MPKTQRSRACHQCRTRRVKCDETPDICQQCRRLGLKCSGPVQGSVIIDMTDRISKPRQREKKEAKPTIKSQDYVAKLPAEGSGVPTPPSDVRRTAAPLQHPVLSPRPNPPIKQEPESGYSHQQLVLSPKHRSRSISSQQEDAITAIRWQHRLPILYQPSQADVYDLAFVSHFVELNKGVRTASPTIPWLTYLPMTYAKIKMPALKLSIRAASMAFYAKVHRDVSILVDSYRWYTMSLNAQRISLARLDGTTIPTDEDVLVPTILGLYEVYAGTAPTSVFQHLTAATKILEMRGPRNCSSGAAFPLFKGIRLSDAHKAVVFNQPSVFSTPEWMTLPFLLEPRNAHQYLTDILLVLPDCIAQCRIKGSLGTFFSSTISPTIDLKPVQRKAAELLRQLDDWAETHPHLCSTSPIPQVTTLDMRHRIDKSAPLTPQSPSLELPDTFVALTAATYRATRLIITLLLHKISRPSAPSDLNFMLTSPIAPSRPELMTDAVNCSRAVLKISEYFESSHPVGFDFMRSVFPLVVVAILGPESEQKSRARQTLDRWGEKRGVGGLCGTWIDV